MLIVINTITTVNFEGDKVANTSFINELIKQTNPIVNDYKYLFIVNDEAIKNGIIDNESISTLVVQQKSKSYLASLIWNNIQLPHLLKRLKADVVIQPNGSLSLLTRQPQVLIIPSLVYQLKTKSFSGLSNRYLRFKEKYNLNNAKQIICLSYSIKNQLINKYPLIGTKLSVIYPLLVDVYQPIDFNEKRTIKDSYANGREYFLFTGGNQPHANLEVLLKAFSIFKRWQHSNMKLLVTGTFTKQKNDIRNKLSNYKYREDVVILNNLLDEKLPKIIAGAYTIINSSTYEAFSTKLVAAMKCGVPVIASGIEGNKEVCGEAALYFETNDIEALANQLKTIYKDEALAKLNIEKGFERVKFFANQDAANSFLEVILQCKSS